MNADPLICSRCRGSLDRDVDWLRCAGGHEWPIENEIADFAEGKYYDSFDEDTHLRAGHAEGLQLELEGTRRRVLDYYAPIISAGIPADTARATRVLDCGCGNGLSVDLLCDGGLDAWGNDVSALRKWQWRERRHRDRLVVASAMTLPFPDGYFDLIISSGVIEHLGVEETAEPRYTVRPLADRHEIRRAFFRELSRVLAPGGRLFIDCPNRLFPIDFWHADRPGRPRFHSPREPFLPSFGEIADYASTAFPDGRIEALSPHRRLQFHQASSHWYGRTLARPADLFFKLMTFRRFRFLASGFLNPFLVVQITKAS